MGMGIKEFASASGVPAHTLRRLHESGKLVPSEVSPGGHRRYEVEQLSKARNFVKEMKLLPGGRSVISDIESKGGFYPYLLGLVLADGSLTKKGQIQLEMKDRQIMDDIASILGCDVHSRKNRPMYRLTVPIRYSCELMTDGVEQRKGVKGFYIPTMCSKDFGIFLRGLFDGDGSLSIRNDNKTVRFHGHPIPMADIQKTLLKEYGLYLPWVKDNRCNSGMLETSRKFVVESLSEIMYSENEICLKRKMF